MHHMMYQMKRMAFRQVVLMSAASLLMAACGGGDGSGASSPGAPATAAPAVTAGGKQTPDAGGTVIEVDMVTTDQGDNLFVPAEVDASPGDVVRFKLVSGVHNVHFVADSSPGVPGLPPAGELLQLPGQTYDLKVTYGPGRYYFQCDPHALLGMVGHLNVKQR